MAAANRLALVLGDKRSFRFYRRVCKDVRAGKLPMRDVRDALFWATTSGRDIAKPGAYFATMLKERLAPVATKMDSPAARHPELRRVLNALVRPKLEPKALDRAAKLLAEVLQDAQHLSFYRRLCEAIREGAIALDAVEQTWISTYSRSEAEPLRSPGGYFRSMLPLRHEEWEQGPVGSASRQASGVPAIESESLKRLA